MLALAGCSGPSGGDPEETPGIDSDRLGASGAGMDAGTLRPGDRLVVSGSPGRREANRLYIQTLERPSDGYSYHQVGSRPRLRSAGLLVRPEKSPASAALPWP